MCVFFGNPPLGFTKMKVYPGCHFFLLSKRAKEKKKERKKERKKQQQQQQNNKEGRDYVPYIFLHNIFHYFVKQNANENKIRKRKFIVSAVLHALYKKRM